LTGLLGVFTPLNGVTGVVAVTGLVATEVFLGDGVGGNTLGSFAKNVLMGVLGLSTSSLFFNTTFAPLGESSGNPSKFNRRRTSYHQHFEKGTNLDIPRRKSTGGSSHPMTTPSDFLLEGVITRPSIAIAVIEGNTKVDYTRCCCRERNVGGICEGCFRGIGGGFPF
jgi:hypothetical protein